MGTGSSDTCSRRPATTGAFFPCLPPCPLCSLTDACVRAGGGGWCCTCHHNSDRRMLTHGGLCRAAQAAWREWPRATALSTCQHPLVMWRHHDGVCRQSDSKVSAACPLPSLRSRVTAPCDGQAGGTAAESTGRRFGTESRPVALHHGFLVRLSTTPHPTPFPPPSNGAAASLLVLSLLLLLLLMPRWCSKRSIFQLTQPRCGSQHGGGGGRSRAGGQDASRGGGRARPGATTHAEAFRGAGGGGAAADLRLVGWRQRARVRCSRALGGRVE